MEQKEPVFTCNGSTFKISTTDISTTELCENIKKSYLFDVDSTHKRFRLADQRFRLKPIRAETIISYLASIQRIDIYNDRISIYCSFTTTRHVSYCFDNIINGRITIDGQLIHQDIDIILEDDPRPNKYRVHMTLVYWFNQQNNTRIIKYNDGTVITYTEKDRKKMGVVVLYSSFIHLDGKLVASNGKLVKNASIFQMVKNTGIITNHGTIAQKKGILLEDTMPKTSQLCCQCGCAVMYYNI